MFLGYGECGEMGYRLWDPESRKIVCSCDVFFDEEKMHKKHVRLVEIQRVVFKEDEHVLDAQPSGQSCIPQANEQGKLPQGQQNKVREEVRE